MAYERPADGSYRLTVDRKPGYLHLSATGNNTAGNVRLTMKGMLSACSDNACSRVLLEEHLIGPSLGTVEVFELVTEGSHTAQRIIEHLAYVDTNPEHDSTLLDFIETVAVNRGVRVRVFATVGEAEAWLATLPPL